MLYKENGKAEMEERWRIRTYDFRDKPVLVYIKSVPNVKMYCTFKHLTNK